MKGCIDKKFAELKEQGRAGLITYTMCNDPDQQTSLEILKALPEAGADILELGMPFSDPMAEGPTIQAAAKRALESGGSVKSCLEVLKEFRESNSETPVILMGYFNPIHHYGVEKFVDDAVSAGADGCIIVDLPPEEEKEFTDYADKKDLYLIKLSSPTTDQERAGIIYDNASGFGYYVSITGITGTKTADFSAVENHLKELRKATDLPFAVGFGIKTPEHVKDAAKFADAVVVGSAIVKTIEENPGKEVEEVSKLARDLSEATLV